MRFDTKAVHAGVTPDPSTGAIMTPIFQTSTYVQQSPGNHKGFEYSRTQNPTRFALQDSIAALENARYGLVFGSGLAAIDAVIKLLKPGDEVISANDLYGGTYRIFTKVFENFGIKFHFIGMEDVANIENYVNDNTKLIWLETPTNPMMNIVDIKGAAAIAKKHNIILGVDNTFASPALQNPMDLGADIVMHSVTKYLGGHSDVVMGALAMNSDVLYQRLAFIQNSCGAVAGPQDCFLVLRGIKTLHLRMQRHCENGEKVARYLAEHPKVNKVYWPGFESHPNHAIAKEQMRGFGGMISFTFHEDDMQQSFRVMERFKVFALAESLGGVESMANHPATMTHGAIPREERMKVGLLDSLIRLSVGIEDADDLIADLEQAIG
ncbi:MULTISPECIES: PLP-dependent aspartate aminotransferase family protein [Roseivirga]|jgi:cystathionine beta-lyase/cystathionine gamma-synthase|uniref:Cystathionine beta-lyase n=1 Tax=Roseivirga thermotolerans TaxID=1758176 RepID=A0ABQ3I871_9BACT|nr:MULTISPECIES: PLP-dependent aspartate aminotransferase family protein [Roseivirga]GHE62223.1 cystathionine beta-lyase [Roseivirga thermotolerans]|tara:strand:+ start:5735 stop:6874 length:1140 start_codon:yes stop_codon:yes gene_type:complete